jgi:hypothetical protein
MCQPAPRKKLLLEAFMYLVWARVLLCLLPFRYLTKILNRGSSFNQPLTDFERRRLRENVAWAIERAARYLPGATPCFPRGIAAHAMCRARGVDSTLYYGAANLPDTGLSAHVWVADGSNGIVGHQIAGDYRIIARFPR